MVTKKNIILVTVDSLRNDYYGDCEENYRFLNYLRNKSIYYSNCHSLGDDTGSIFPQLLSSTYLNLIPYKKRDKATEISGVSCRIAEPRKSIAETLQEEGYNTYSFQTAPQLAPFFGYDRGFDGYYYVNPFSTGVIPFISYLYKHPYTKAKELNDLIISKDFKEPFFLWIHYNDIHEPYSSYTFPRFLSDFLWYKYIRRPSYADLADLTLNSISSTVVRKFRNLYKKQVEYMDTFLYSLFVKKDKFNLDESLFILTADHGQALGEYNQWGHGYCVLPTRELSNVPLYVSEPNQNIGKEDSSLCSLLDIVPTICDIVDLPKMEIYDGVSLSDESWKGYNHLVWSNSLDFEISKFSLRIIKDPYIFWQDDFNFKSPRIYTIKNNEIIIVNDNKLMNEFTKLASKHIDYIRTKQLKYNKNLNSMNNLKKELDPEVLDALKALGYV